MPATALTAQVWPGPQWRQQPPIGSFTTNGIYTESSGALVVVGGNAPALRTWRWLGTWSEIVAPTAPGRLGLFSVAYDSGRNTAVLFGGLQSTLQVLGETWEFDGVAWSLRQFPVAPAPRYQAALAFDPLRQRIVLFGGGNLSTTLGDTWEYDGLSWVQRTLPVSPAAGSGVAMTYAPNLQKLLSVHVGPNQQPETWTYDGAAWVQLAPANSPSARTDARLAHDPVRGRTVLFSGLDALTGFKLTDTWEFDGTNWQVVPTGTAPAGLYGRGMDYSPLFGGVVCHGGAPGGIPAASAAVYAWNGTSWNQATAEYPFFRNNPQLAYDSARDCIVKQGGIDGTGTYQLDTWEWHQGTWTQTAVGVGPTTAIAYDARRQCTVGIDGGTTWEYRATGWLAHQLTPTPPSGAIWFDRHDGVIKVAANATVWHFDGVSWQSQSTAGGSPSSGVTHFSARDRAVAFPSSFGAVQWFDGATWSATVSLPAAATVPQLVEDVRRGALLGLDLQNESNVWFDGVLWRTQPVDGQFEMSGVNLTADAVTGRVFAVDRTGRVWQADWPDTATLARYGRGCPGSAGTPRLERVGPTTPLLGQLLPLRLSSLPPTPGLAVLALGDSIEAAAGQPLPQSLAVIGLPQCALWTPVLGTTTLVHAGNALTLTLPLPANPSLAGVLFTFQAFVLDQAAPNGIGSVSNAVLGMAR